ncbi:MAG TPA: T9SS type A sorting domain-containing protein, partial [Candidatus Eisenbacteria bacterium]
SSAGATYTVDVISGTSAAPVYTNGATLTRTGGGWAQPSGNQLPQSAPNAGASACGATPCRIESQDAQVRSAPVFRNGSLYYTQTIGLPTGTLTRTAVQWTRLTAVGGAFAEGGRIDDPTATATNGGKWYAYGSIAVNSVGDFIVGYTQFSSAQHPSAGYSLRLVGDGAGTIRDPFIYKVGDDYYHKTFSTATGRNRWGDYSTSQVDPSDDRSLWTIQEYAKTRTGTDDGNTGSNSSRWSSWWAGVKTAYTITASAGPNGSVSPSGATAVVVGGSQAYTITANACYHIVDVLVDGVSQGPIANYNFTNVTADHTISATFALNTYTIVASAGAGGSISPSGNVNVNCGANQSFAITANACFAILDVVVDGSSVGPVANYTFNTVTANHTISASFTPLSYTITATAGTGGSITPSGAVNVACGDEQVFVIEPQDKCWVIADVLVDGVSVGPVSSYAFGNVQANHTIDATFTQLGPFTITATANPGGTITPAGAVLVDCGASQTFTFEPTDKCWYVSQILVDGVEVDEAGFYIFTDVQANHTIEVSFAQGDPFTITATAGPGGSITPSGSVSVACGDDQNFTIVANVGFVIDDVVVDGSSVGPVGVYNFTDVQEDHTIDATFRDVACPYVEVLVPNGGEELIIGLNTNLTWNASDNVGVTCVDLHLSRTGSGGPFEVIASCIANSGSYPWTVTGPATSDAWFKVIARDEAGNECADLSNEPFTIEDVVVPILLSQFQVNALENGVELRWGVSDAASFIKSGIERSDRFEGPYVELTAPVRVDGMQSILVDRDVTNGQLYWYRLAGLTRSGQVVTFEPLSVTAGLPISAFSLPAIKPNPTRGVAHVTFSVPAPSHVKLTVFDIQGRAIATLADRSFDPGRYELSWNGEGNDGRVPAGTYFVHLESANTRLVQRVVLVH